MLGVINLPGYFDPVFIGAVISLCVTLAVSRRGTVSEAEHTLRQKLHEVPAEDLDPVRTRNSLIAAKLLIAYALLSPVMILTLYVRPYHKAIGRLADGQWLDWTSMDTLLPFCGATIILATGLVSHRAIRKAYAP